MSPLVKKGALLPTQESHGGGNAIIDDNSLKQQTICSRRETIASDHIANLGFCCGLFCFGGLFYFGEKRKKFFFKKAKMNKENTSYNKHYSHKA